MLYQYFSDRQDIQNLFKCCCLLFSFLDVSCDGSKHFPQNHTWPKSMWGRNEQGLGAEGGPREKTPIPTLDDRVIALPCPPTHEQEQKQN